MKTRTKQESKAKIKRGITELIIPHENTVVTFAYPSFGTNTYRDVGKQILENNLQIPTSEQIASLLHASYCSELKDEPEFQNIRKIMSDRWLWVFNRNLWTDKGVYVIPDLEAKGLSETLNENELEALLKNGKEINGVRFSKDKKVRFAPKDSYKDELAENGFVVASYGKEGAEQLAEISTKFLSGFRVYGLNLQKGDTSQLRCSALGGYGGYGLEVVGDDFDDYRRGCSFGVFK